MSYVFLLILLFPVKLIRKLFRKDTGKNLVIQTAKIGDFINATPLLAYLQKSDVLISRSVARWRSMMRLLSRSILLSSISATCGVNCASRAGS
jgi:hypothetical protein